MVVAIYDTIKRVAKQRYRKIIFLKYTRIYVSKQDRLEKHILIKSLSKFVQTKNRRLTQLLISKKVAEVYLPHTRAWFLNVSFLIRFEIISDPEP